LSNRNTTQKRGKLEGPGRCWPTLFILFCKKNNFKI
jgi:hypothetical protein